MLSPQRPSPKEVVTTPKAAASTPTKPGDAPLEQAPACTPTNPGDAPTEWHACPPFSPSPLEETARTLSPPTRTPGERARRERRESLNVELAATPQRLSLFNLTPGASDEMPTVEPPRRCPLVHASSGSIPVLPIDFSLPRVAAPPPASDNAVSRDVSQAKLSASALMASPECQTPTFLAGRHVRSLSPHRVASPWAQVRSGSAHSYTGQQQTRQCMPVPESTSGSRFRSCLIDSPVVPNSPWTSWPLSLAATPGTAPASATPPWTRRSALSSAFFTQDAGQGDQPRTRRPSQHSSSVSPVRLVSRGRAPGGSPQSTTPGKGSMGQSRFIPVMATSNDFTQSGTLVLDETTKHMGVDMQATCSPRSKCPQHTSTRASFGPEALSQIAHGQPSQRIPTFPCMQTSSVRDRRAMTTLMQRGLPQHTGSSPTVLTAANLTASPPGVATAVRFRSLSTQARTSRLTPARYGTIAATAGPPNTHGSTISVQAADRAYSPKSRPARATACSTPEVWQRSFPKYQAQTMISGVRTQVLDWWKTQPTTGTVVRPAPGCTKGIFTECSSQPLQNPSSFARAGGA